MTDNLPYNTLAKIPAKRIVSLVPSITELLFYLELSEEVVGITKFCVHPKEWFETKPRIGGTKTVDIAAVKALHADLIIAAKEENVQEQVEELQKTTPVLLFAIETLEDALNMILEIGKITGKTFKASQLVDAIKTAFAQITPLKENIRTAYLIWKNPYMAAGGDTFINDLLTRCGFANVFENVTRYPITTPEQLSEMNCNLLLLSSEPYPFSEKHVLEIQAQLPNCKIKLVDGEMFSWYGSRLLPAASYFKNLIAEINY